MAGLLSRVLGLGSAGGEAPEQQQQQNGPGGRDPYWVDDDKVSACYECEAPFGVLARRHHCRVCGRIFCAACAANSIAPPRGSAEQQWQRVCNHCERASGGAE